MSTKSSNNSSAAISIPQGYRPAYHTLINYTDGYDNTHTVHGYGLAANATEIPKIADYFQVWGMWVTNE